MKKILISILAFSMLLFGCSSGSKTSEEDPKEAMKAAVDTMLTNIQNGNFDDLDASLENMPTDLANYVGYLSVDEESSNSLVKTFQDLVKSQTKKLEYKITDVTYDEESKTGTVSVEFKYIDMTTRLVLLSKEIVKIAAKLVASKLFNNDNTDEIDEKFSEAFDDVEENYQNVVIDFEMVNDNGQWKINDTNNTIIDIISGNSFEEIEEIIDAVRGIEE